MHRLAPRQLGIAAGQNESKPPRRDPRPKLYGVVQTDTTPTETVGCAGCECCASPFGAAYGFTTLFPDLAGCEKTKTGHSA